jgi:hypothetical protein
VNLNKYDIQEPIKSVPPSNTPLQDWKESDAVILLSEYLKIKSRCGIKLCQHDGEPCLVFNPALQTKEKNPERWAVAENLCELFIPAVDDLKELISTGKLAIPAAPIRRMQ